MGLSVVIPLGTGSRLKDFELRMCLRSIETHLTGYKDIWIIGEHPDWLQNINHVPVKDTSHVPDFNIMKKITAACEHPDVSESFLFFNDDHFLLAPFDAKTFPYYYEGDLAAYVKNRGLDGYGTRANNTLKVLQSKDLPLKYFDIHTPIIYHKEAFITHVSKQNWRDHGFIIKSLYANSLRVEGESLHDNKINKPPEPNMTIFSTMPHLKASVIRALKELFPIKSKYERVDI